MALLSTIIQPNNILTNDNVKTVTNKTISFSGNTFTGTLGAPNGGTGISTPGVLGNVLTSDGTGWISAPPSGAVTPFLENFDNVTANYTIVTGQNALSVGPMTIDSGVTVTVESGQRWLVL